MNLFSRAIQPFFQYHNYICNFGSVDSEGVVATSALSPDVDVGVAWISALLAAVGAGVARASALPPVGVAGTLHCL